ncbi:MAG: tRNA 2-thiouridine(34) synthase MnmA [Acidobacteria bacterium]|nr:tRNA 2-thiouridine(34) synthase MnmA [Acidobacteriota bacterium]
MPENSKIAVAMSGGVDSSVVAGMMARGDAPVVGLTMQLWNQRRLPEIANEGATGGRCCSLDDVYDARYVAQLLKIPYYVVNLEDRFEKHVVKPFVEDYIAGKTPIPCTLCNNFIKFEHFLEMADGIGAEKIATGHYARIRFDEPSGRWQLLRSVDASKDQTYFLWGLTQEQLSRTLFPLGGMVKTDVRQLAMDLGLPVAEKPDSQEICFVPNGDYAAFIEAYFKEQGITTDVTSGDIVDRDGKKLGKHEGVHHFTVGQRRGLNVAVGEPLYVIETNPATRQVTVGSGDALMKKQFRVGEVNWISLASPTESVRAEVRIRNRHQPAWATIRPVGLTEAEVEFDVPQRAVTPGQGAVFYQGDVVAGGGWIEREA